ncbi:MAG: TetR/AcrR family transcriptional regulator [Actinobacteria bacterium]|nr:TetR/AcrR family transcriptional regulator [Actinomycetota bacterium]
MPRDATETRARLIREAERLFARRGVYEATLREITEAAGQRNVSALNYHFGSREGIVEAILQQHGDPLDDARGRHLVEPIEEMPTFELVAALLVPLAEELAHPSGRDYLRIVAQLSHRFPAWRLGDALVTPHLRRVLNVLESRASGADPSVRRERVVDVIMMMMTSMAERARVVDRGRAPELDLEAFVTNLTDMIVGALEAPSRLEAALSVPSGEARR